METMCWPGLDLTALYASYAGRGKVPHRPDLMLSIVLFELRRGQRKPSQWFHDTYGLIPTSLLPAAK